MWPVLWWNAQHGWVGVLHLAAQSGFGRTMSLRPFEFLASQLAVGLPVSLLLPWAVRWAWRQRAARPAAWLLACAALTPLAVLLGASMQAKVQANWAALSWIPAALLVACWLPHAGTAWPRRALFGGAALALLAAVLISAAPALRQRFPALPPSVPERKLAGWDELATAVASSLAAQPERTVILTAGYDVAAQLAWHNRELPRPLCANFGRRMNQYDLWQQLDETRSGWDALFVSEIARDDALDGDLLARLPAGLRDDFAGAAPPRLLRIAYGSRSWRCFLIVRLRGFDGRLDSARTISSW